MGNTRRSNRQIGMTLRSANRAGENDEVLARVQRARFRVSSRIVDNWELTRQTERFHPRKKTPPSLNPNLTKHPRPRKTTPKNIVKARFTPQQEAYTSAPQPSIKFILRSARKYRPDAILKKPPHPFFLKQRRLQR